MKAQYYMSNFTEEEEKFIKDNLKYLNIRENTSNIMATIIYNKFVVERDIALNVRNGLVEIPLNIYNTNTSVCRFSDIQNYDEFSKMVSKAIKRLEVSVDELRWFLSRQLFFSAHQGFELNGTKFTSYAHYGHDLVSILHSILEFATGETYDDLKEIRELLTESGTKYCPEALVTNEFDFIEGMKVKTYKNGKIEVKNCTPRVIAGLETFQKLYDTMQYK